VPAEEIERPCVSDQVGMLRTELQSSLGTVVQAQPEPERAPDGALGIAAAVTERSGTVTVPDGGTVSV